MWQENDGEQQEHFEEVSIEAVHVGDYLSLPSAGLSPSEARCVLAKAPMRLQPTKRLVGWHVEVARLGALWLPAQTKVKRRRFESAATAPAALANRRPR